MPNEVTVDPPTPPNVGAVNDQPAPVAQPVSADPGTVAVVTGPQQSESPDFLVFVSYRIQPDEHIARAFKVLLEEVLEPKPKVFVSGVGGLRVSKLGFKTQIQRAAQSTRVMVGIITENSLDREWIYYEAGAAFGRGIAYAPVVFGVGLGDLPSSISDNQATDYRNEETFRSLIAVIAGEIGAEVRGRVLKRRYKDFLDAVGKNKEDHSRGRENDPDEMGIQEISDLLKSGDRAGAKARSEVLLAGCSDAKKKKALSVRVAVKLATKGQELEDLEGLPAESKGCPEYHFFRYIYLRDFRPQQAESCLQEYLTAAGRADGDPYGLLYRVGAHIDLNQIDSAGKLLREMLGSDKQETRRIAAGYIADTPIKGMLFGERLLCALRGLATYDGELLHSIGALVHDAGLFSLAGRCFKTIAEQEPSGRSSHRYGMSLHEMEFLSLAYDAYATAERMGLLVSVATKASLFDSGKVAAHGIKILTEHQAGFADAASKAFPHGVRRDLEVAVEKEMSEWKAVADETNSALLCLIQVSDDLVGAPTGEVISDEHGFALGDAKYRVEGAEDLTGGGSLLIPEFHGLTRGVVLADCYFGTANKKFVVVKARLSHPLLCEVSWQQRKMEVVTHDGVSIVKMENRPRSSDLAIPAALQRLWKPT